MRIQSSVLSTPSQKTLSQYYEQFYVGQIPLRSANTKRVQKSVKKKLLGKAPIARLIPVQTVAVQPTWWENSESQEPKQIHLQYLPGDSSILLGRRLHWDQEQLPVLLGTGDPLGKS